MNEEDYGVPPMLSTAIVLHEFYQSLLEVGFSEEQALTMVMAYLQSSVQIRSEGDK